MDGKETGSQIVVVVPVLNEALGIEDCLTSILSHPSMDAVPVIVTDGGSTDGTGEIVGRLAERHANLRTVENPARRQAAGVNAVGLSTPASVLVRCDAHAIYPSGFVAAVAAALDRTGADAVAVVIDAEAPPGASLFARANALAVDTRLGSGGSAHRGGSRSGWADHGHHAGLRLEPFRRLGGYDETLIANEDAEYDTRLRRAGGRVWLEASLRVRYFVRETPLALWQQYHRYGQGRAIHLRRHRTMPRLRQIVPPMHVALLALSVMLLPLMPDAAIYPVAYLTVLLAFSTWLAIRRRTAVGLLAFVPLVIMHLAWGTGFWRGLFAR